MAILVNGIEVAGLGKGVPQGGAANQYLIKKSGVDYDTTWVGLQNSNIENGEGEFSIQMIDGNSQANGDNSTAFGLSTIATGKASHAEGGYQGQFKDFNDDINEVIVTVYGSSALGDFSHAEGQQTYAGGQASHSEGLQTGACGISSHAEGRATKASGDHSHAEGDGAMSSGYASHAEGENTEASGTDSHAEGYNTEASGNFSHAEGANTVASGHSSHAEGYSTKALGDRSHAEGYRTVADGIYQHVQGKYNIIDEDNTYAHIVGNGGGDSNRSNAHTLDWNGDAWFAGNVYVGNKENSIIKLTTTEDLANYQLPTKFIYHDLNDDPDLPDGVEGAILITYDTSSQ